MSNPQYDMANMWKSREDKVRWTAERENASARIALSSMHERIWEMLSQHEPVASLGLDRDALRKVLDYIRTGGKISE